MYGYKLFENGTLNRYGNFDVEDPALYQTDVLRREGGRVDRGDRGRHAALPLADVRRAARRGRDAPAARPQPYIRPAPRHVGALRRLPEPALVPRRARRQRQAGLRPRACSARTRRRRARVRADFRARRESLLAVDDAVAAVVAALARTGRLDSTYILFTSDNGFFQGEHRIVKGKYLAYDPSSHVPLLIRGPGIPPGTVSGELVANTDLAPTLLDATGATADTAGRRALAAPVRSRSAAAHAPARPARRARRRATSTATARRARHRVPRYRAIRTAPLPLRRVAGRGARALRPRPRPRRDALAPRRPPLPAPAALAAPGAAAPARLRRRRRAGRPSARCDEAPAPARPVVDPSSDAAPPPPRRPGRRSSPCSPCPPPRSRAACRRADQRLSVAGHDLRRPADADLAAAARPRSRLGTIRVTGSRSGRHTRPAARALGRPGRELRAAASASAAGSGSPCGPVCRSRGTRNGDFTFRVARIPTARDDPEPASSRDIDAKLVRARSTPAATSRRRSSTSSSALAGRAPGLPVPEPEVQEGPEAGRPDDRRQQRAAGLVPAAARRSRPRPTSAPRPTRASRCSPTGAAPRARASASARWSCSTSPTA